MKSVSKKKASLIAAISLLFSVVWGMAGYYFLGPATIKQYQTLSQISDYAKTLPEFPISDDNEWVDPHYETFYQKRSPNMIELILRQLGFPIEEPWSPRYLSTLVKELTKQNRSLGLLDGKNNFVHIKAIEKNNIYVFGDMHGAFHSLIRNLHFLKEEGIIDDNLRIIKSNSYLIFNGDFIDRSAYNVDSLILLGLLLKNNPLNVIYVAGNHERDLHWLDYGLKRELVIRGNHLSKQKIPFQEQIDDFFKTLPEAVYLSDTKGDKKLVRIAFYEQKRLSFPETLLSPKFLSQTEPVKVHYFLKREDSESKIDVIAAIKTEEWRKSNRIRHGLGLLDQDQGATTWAILSSPTSVHKAFLDFHDDAFALVQVGEDINKTTISQIFHNSLAQDGYKKLTPKNIVSSRMDDSLAKNNVIKSAIKVASTLSLIGGVPTMGQQVQRGLNVSVNNFNQDAKNTRHIRLYIDNDDYLPPLARANVVKYLDSQIKFLLLPTGTPTLLSYLNFIKSHDFIVMFPIAGAPELRDPQYKNLIHFRAGYDDEVRALIKALIEEYSALKFAFFYEDNAYGRGPFKTAVEELKKAGITEYLALPYTRGIVDFGPQIKEITKNQPDALGFFATSTASQEFIRQLGINNVANTQLFAASFAAELTLRHFAKRHGLNFLYGSSVPNPKTSQIEIAQLYRREMDRINSDYDAFSFEAFIASKLFLFAVKALENKEINPKNIMEILESIKDLDFMGIKIGFDPKTRSLARRVWLETGEDVPWREYPTKNP